MHAVSASTAFAAHSWPIRCLRACAAALVSLILAIGGHRLGGGEVAAAWLIAVMFALVLGAAFLLGGRRATTGQIVGLLLIGQIGIHSGCMGGGEPVSLGFPMLIGHLLATAIAATVLTKGEVFLWTVAQRLALRCMVIFSQRDRVAVSRPARAHRHDVDLLLLGFLGSGVGLRGPPARCA